MSQTYKARGINLKGIPLGEVDRLLTVLTPEYGLVRAVAPGARKPKSRLRGRTELFVVNDLLIVKGKSLDKVIQAETKESYPGLSKDLGKLSASQYLAEVVLCIGLSNQPQEEIYELLLEHLARIEQLTYLSSKALILYILAHLSHAMFHLLAIAGIVPQVHTCCWTQTPVKPDLLLADWQAGFSFEAGGIINLSTSQHHPEVSVNAPMQITTRPKIPPVNVKLNGTETALLQQLNLPELPENSLDSFLPITWLKIERLLRNYFQYQFGKSIRSATLLDTLANAAVE